MANSKIYLGSTNIGSLFQGASDISIYLGEEKVYPLVEPSFDGKFKATYNNSTTYSAACDSSTELTTATTKPSGYEYTAMTKAEIGCVTNINPDTFRYCTSLTSVTIGSGVTSIDNGAFDGCTRLTSITVNATTPPTLGSNAFNGSTCPIYVPSASVNAYKSATGWSAYTSRIQTKPNS